MLCIYWRRYLFADFFAYYSAAGKTGIGDDSYVTVYQYVEWVLFRADADQRESGADGSYRIELLYGDVCQQLFRIICSGGNDSAADDFGIYSFAKAGYGKFDGGSGKGIEERRKTYERQ